MTKRNRPEPIPILFLYEGGLKSSYAEGLREAGFGMEWASTTEALLAQQGKAFALVLIDLDTFAGKEFASLEQVRTAFPSTDLIALASEDSSQLALRCLRAGFADFLLKPLTPEELIWNLQKHCQRREVLTHFSDPGEIAIRAMSKTAAATSPWMVRVSILECLQELLGGAGSAWIQIERRSSPGKVLCALPRKVPDAEVLFAFPSSKVERSPKTAWVFRQKRAKTRKVILRVGGASREYIFLWGLKKAVAKARLVQVRFLLQYADLMLLNLRRLSEIKQQTFLDELTGLFNARYLRFAVSDAVKRSQASHKSFSVLFIDVDHFKSVNDRYGHLVGSEFLVAISRTIKNSVRNHDSVFRYGGDEFIVLLQDALTPLARTIAERIRRNIAKRIYSIQSNRIQTTVSIGLATFPQHAQSEDQLLRLADHAMYAAKRLQRNRVQLAEAPQSVSAEA